MDRRSFLHTAAIGSVSLPLGKSITHAAEQGTTNFRRSFSMDAHRVRIYSDAVKTATRVLVVADTHLFVDDDRGEPYRRYSARMAAAYNQTTHFLTGEPTNPELGFAAILEHAAQHEFDFLALVGDIFSFPSEAAIDWVGEKLAATDIKYMYVAGNHDWHYEGQAGSLDELRARWTETRLKHLYQGQSPLMACYDVGDVRIVAIDNSTYQILPPQLAFLRKQIATGKPLVLTVHIPLFAPGRSMGFGCGNPAWGAANDRNFELERRPRWPETGHTTTTFEFHREVFRAPNMLGVFAGHTHRSSLDVINGIPQIVTDDNASAGFTELEILPVG